MKSLYIIGAGDFGREMESWLSMDPIFMDQFFIVGYLDRNPEALSVYPSDYKIVGSPLEFEFKKDDYAIMAITNPKDKLKIGQVLKGKVNFHTYVAPNAVIGKYVKFGEGCVICPGGLVSTNSRIGDLVTVNCGSQIGHDNSIGAYSSIMANVDLGGHVTIGEQVFIGSNACIIPGKSIIDGAFIGAGAIVIRNIVKPGTYFGNPASKIGF